MANPFETTNLKGVKINRKGDIPSLEFGRAPADYLESYQANVSIFSGIDNRLGLLDAEIDKLDKEGLMESIERDKREAEERVNKKSTSEKIAQWTSLASTGLSALNAFSSLGGAKKIASTAQAAAKTVSYSDMSDADLTTKLNEYTKKKTDAQKVIDEQTPTADASLKTYYEHDNNIVALDLDKGMDELCVAYRDFNQYEKGNNELGKALNDLMLYDKGNNELGKALNDLMLYDKGSCTVCTEYKQALDDVASAADDQKDAKQKIADAKKTKIDEAITAKKTEIDKAITAKKTEIANKLETEKEAKRKAAKENGDARDKIARAETTKDQASEQIRLIEAEQSKRATKKKK